MTDAPREILPFAFLDDDDEGNFVPTVVAADFEEEEVDPTPAPAVQMDDALAGAAPQPMPNSATSPASSSKEKSGSSEPPVAVTPSVEPPKIPTPGSRSGEKTTSQAS